MLQNLLSRSNWSAQRTLLVLGILVWMGHACAQTDLQINRFSIDGGGGKSEGGGFTLTGTIGQPDAQIVSGGGFVLVGGFAEGKPAPASPPTTPTPKPATGPNNFFELSIVWQERDFLGDHDIDVDTDDVLFLIQKLK